MLEEYVRENSPEYLTTYTRNPSFVRMVRKVSSEVYPLVGDCELRDIASSMPHATDGDDAHYHIDRYGEAGLFRGSDPADRSVEPGSKPLKEEFMRLESVRNALVIAARVRTGELT